jgi:hypothetical protein
MSMGAKFQLKHALEFSSALKEAKPLGPEDATLWVQYWLANGL